jgi:hypothetical protein
MSGALLHELSDMLQKAFQSVPLMSSSFISFAIFPAFPFTSKPSWSRIDFFGSS